DIVPFVSIDVIVAIISNQDIAASLTVQMICVRPSGDGIIAAPAIDHILTSAAGNDIDASPSGRHSCGGTGESVDVTVIAENHIVAKIALNGVAGIIGKIVDGQDD